ncbi:MAG TPA: TonB-dependent receptor [Bryobacteraceae bacterium]|nr:TonB-dependent receptor [Bryobacteraceae bacterium]
MTKNMCRMLALALFAAGVLLAQKDTAALVGEVKDASGARIANAAVIATETGTDFSYHAQSDSNGEWTISPVRIGTYRISISAKGFKTSVAGPMTLDVQQRQRVDVSLELGQVNETVEVHETAPLLETDTSERGQVINSRTMVGLPLNGRNPVQLAQLTAGVTVSEPGARDESGFGFSANGARSLENNFLLDGIDNNSNLPDLLNETNYVVMPSVDALQEFKVQTDSYGAEFGRATGAVVNATVRSGTNEFHGVLYEFLRNQNLDARNFFDASIPPYHQNQFGATLGGRIIRDKLFFFTDYEGLRIRQGQTLTSLVPTAAQRSGDFSSQLNLSSPTGTLDCNGKPTYSGELFDTTLTQPSASSPTGYCGVPFGYDRNGNPSNVIPASKIDPLGAKLAQLYPMPNANGLGYNYLLNPELVTNRNQGDIRIDQVFSSKDSAFYRFSVSQEPSTIPSPLPGLADGGGFFSGIQQNNGYSLAISETHIFSPTLVNELRLGYNRLHSSRDQFNYDQNVSGSIGFPGVPFAPGTSNGGLPQLTFNDMSNLGSPTYLPSNEIQNTYSVSDTFTLISGGNTWKIGGEFRPEEFTIYQPADPRGSMSFGTQFTDNPADPGSGGSGFSTLLTGQPDGGNINNLNNVDYLRKTFSLFLQDDWHATSKLTLNIGLRYEYFSPVMERFNAQANFNPNTGVLDIPANSNVSLTPTLAGILPVNHNASDALVNSDLNNLAPRLGLAYQVTSRFVFRSAFGMFYNGEENGPFSNPSPGFNPPYFDSQSFVAPCSLPSYNAAAEDCSVPGLRNLNQGFPANSLTDPNTPNLFSIDPNLRTPYVLQWHGTAQYQAGANTLFEVAYVGSKGTKLYTYLNLNQAVPTADPSAPSAPRRPFPFVDSSIGYLNAEGNSEYNALQTKLQHRFGNGLSFIVNYTFSHALGNASNANLGSQNNDSFRWSAQPQWEHGNLDFDVRHRFIASYSYELPFGKGKRFGGGANTLVDLLIGRWELSGITTLSSGTWYTVTDANSNFANSDGQQRPDAVGGQRATGTPCIPGTFFNTCAFTDPVLGSFGNVGLNTLNGPGVDNWDISLLKTIPVGEKRRFEFRSEFFNVANHANFLFAAPGPQNSNNSTVLGTPTFGYVTAARSPRQIQFGLKFYY